MAGSRCSKRLTFGLAGAIALAASGIASAQRQSFPSTQPPAPPSVAEAPPLTLPSIPPGGGSGGPPSGFSPNGPPPGINGPGLPAAQRFTFKIEPNTPTKELLPRAPLAKRTPGPTLSDDLAKVPEAEFQARTAKDTHAKLPERTALQLAQATHLNAKKPDAFMTALLAERKDLAGLPFTMGDACRTSGERMKQFTLAVNTVRQALGNTGVRQPVNFLPTTPSPGTFGGDLPFIPANAPVPQQPTATVSFPPPFWSQYATLCDQEDAARPRASKELTEHVTLARIAALAQMLAAESAELRLGMVKYLAGVTHPEATKVIGRMAIYSSEDEVRAAAVAALKVRRDQDYTEVLVKGLRYPWPAVAKRAAEAIARTGRSDLIPELIAVLDEADPRLPTLTEVGGKTVAVVRELAKVNHHRNCIMCHAPASSGAPAGSEVVAEVPVEGQPLPSLSQGYGRSMSPDLLIRIDVTYLRQDFSAMLPVGDAHPWPEHQRFDFLVRERKLTSAEAEMYREKLTPTEAGVLSPYHKAALAALRDLTGKDTAPTAAAWRTLLAAPAKVSRVPANPR